MAFRVSLRIVAIGVLSLGAFTPAVSNARQSTSYTYDAQGQVRTVTRPSQTITYAYDAAANRTAVTVASSLSGMAAPNKSTNQTTSASASLPESQPAAAALPLAVDVVKLSPAPLAPPPLPISPLTGRPLSAVAPSSGR